MTVKWAMNKVERTPRDLLFMQMAFLWATQSTCSARSSVGVVLVNQLNQVIASGYNGAPRGMPHCDDIGCTLDTDGHCINAVHAEVNAIIQCALSGVSPAGSTMYSNFSPCVRCVTSIIQAGITRVVFAHRYGSPSYFDNVISMLKQAGIEVKGLSALALQMLQSSKRA